MFYASAVKPIKFQEIIAVSKLNLQVFIFAVLQPLNEHLKVEMHPSTRELECTGCKNAAHHKIFWWLVVVVVVVVVACDCVCLCVVVCLCV